MKALLFDLEANGLLDTATKIHCCVTLDLITEEVNKYYGDTLYDGIKELSSADIIAGHNVISYDIPLVRKLYDIDMDKKCIVDTYVWSYVLSPNRGIPFGAKGVKSGHSLAAWGYRVGRGKPEHNDWEEFDMEMLHRCSEDVEINFLALQLLEKEAGVTALEFY